MIKYKLPPLPEEVRLKLEERISFHTTILRGIKCISSDDTDEYDWPLKLELALPYIAAESMVPFPAESSGGYPSLSREIDHKIVTQYLEELMPWSDNYTSVLIRDETFQELIAKRIAINRFNLSFEESHKQKEYDCPF